MKNFVKIGFVVFFWVFICVSLLICASFCGVSWRFMVIYIMECFIAISCDQRLVGTINWRIGQDPKSHRDEDPEVPAQQGTFWVCPLSPVDGPREPPRFAREFCGWTPRFRFTTRHGRHLEMSLKVPRF